MVYAINDRSYAGFGTQSTAQGTPGTCTFFQTITENSIKLMKPEQETLPVLRNLMGETISFDGNTHIEGNITGPLMPDEAFNDYAWAMMMGNNNAVSGSASVGFSHVFSEPRWATQADWPAYGCTIEALKGSIDTTLMFDYAGCFGKAIETVIPETGVITRTMEFLGTNETSGTTVSVPTYTTKNPFAPSHAKLQIGAAIGSVADVKLISGKYRYENQAQLIWNRGSAAPVSVYWPQIPMFTFEFTIYLEDLTIYNYWLNKTEIAAKIILTHTQQAGSTSGVYSETILIPRVLLLGTPPTITGKGLVPITFQGKAMRSAADGYTINVTVVNSKTGTIAV